MTTNKYCSACDKDISYKGWSRHIKTTKHINNVDSRNDDRRLNVDSRMVEKVEKVEKGRQNDDKGGIIDDNIVLLEDLDDEKVDLLDEKDDLENDDSRQKDDLMVEEKDDLNVDNDIVDSRKVEKTNPLINYKYNVDNKEREKYEKLLIELIIKNPDINIDDKIRQKEISIHIRNRVANMDIDELIDKIKMYKFNKNKKRKDILKNTLISTLSDFINGRLSGLTSDPEQFLENQKQSQMDKCLEDFFNEYGGIGDTILDTFVGNNIIYSISLTGINLLKDQAGSLMNWFWEEGDEDYDSEDEEEEDREVDEIVENFIINEEPPKPVKSTKKVLSEKKEKNLIKELARKHQLERPSGMEEPAWNKYVLKYKDF